MRLPRLRYAPARHLVLSEVEGMTFSLSLLPKAQILSNFSENSLEHVILRSEAPIGHTYPQGVYDDEGSTASTSRFFASALLRLTLRSDIFIIVVVSQRLFGSLKME